MEGSLLVGFVNISNQPFATTINTGDVFVFSRGFLHLELNVGEGQAIGIGALNSQNPGVQAQAAALFGSGISDVVLEKSFGLSEKAVDHSKSKFIP